MPAEMESGVPLGDVQWATRVYRRPAPRAFVRAQPQAYRRLWYGESLKRKIPPRADCRRLLDGEKKEKTNKRRLPSVAMLRPSPFHGRPNAEDDERGSMRNPRKQSSYLPFLFDLSEEVHVPQRNNDRLII